jgi:hypothetical protein
LGGRSVAALALFLAQAEGLPLVVVAMRPPSRAETLSLTELLTDPATSAVRPGPLTAASIGATGCG